VTRKSVGPIALNVEVSGTTPFPDFVSEGQILPQIFAKGLSGLAACETFVGEIILHRLGLGISLGWHDSSTEINKINSSVVNFLQNVVDNGGLCH
jgi:hypothetical protein